MLDRSFNRVNNINVHYYSKIFKSICIIFTKGFIFTTYLYFQLSIFFLPREIAGKNAVQT